MSILDASPRTRARYPTWTFLAIEGAFGGSRSPVTPSTNKLKTRSVESSLRSAMSRRGQESEDHSSIEELASLVVLRCHRDTDIWTAPHP